MYETRNSPIFLQTFRVDNKQGITTYKWAKATGIGSGIDKSGDNEREETSRTQAYPLLYKKDSAAHDAAFMAHLIVIELTALSKLLLPE